MEGVGKIGELMGLPNMLSEGVLSQEEFPRHLVCRFIGSVSLGVASPAPPYQGHSVPLLLVPDVAMLLRHYRETFAIFPLCGERFLSVEVTNSGRLSLSHIG